MRLCLVLLKEGNDLGLYVVQCAAFLGEVLMQAQYDQMLVAQLDDITVIAVFQHRVAEGSSNNFRIGGDTCSASPRKGSALLHGNAQLLTCLVETIGVL